MIRLIAIVDEKFGVSKNGKIPWSFKEDLESFKDHTENCVVVMGRKTFFSIPNAPLKNRINCVVSRTLKTLEDAEVFSSLEDVIEKYKNVWIIGGAEIYNYSLKKKLIEYALITQVHKDFAADNFINESLLFYLEKKTLFDTNEYSIYEYFISN